MKTQRWDNYIDTLRLNESQLTELLAVRKKAVVPGRDKPGTEARAYKRVRVHGCLWVPAEITEPSGSSRLMKVYPIDISSTGMCLLIGLYVHRGSKCVITFNLPDGELIPVEGKVIRSGLLQGRAHEMAISLEEPFDMSMLQMDASGIHLTPPEGHDAHHASDANAAADGGKEHRGLPAKELAAIGTELGQLSERVGPAQDVAKRLHELGALISSAYAAVAEQAAKAPVVPNPHAEASQTPAKHDGGAH